MERKKKRTNDIVEKRLERVSGVLQMIGAGLLCLLVLVGLICSISFSYDQWGDWDPLLFLLYSMGFAIPAVVVGIGIYLTKIFFDYLIDIHYFSRTQMEVALETVGIEIAEPESESWTCENCGKTHGNDVSFCTNCGTKKPEKS